LRAEIAVKFSLVASHIKVVAVKAVKKILEGNDTLYVLELSNNTLDLLSSNTSELLGGNCHGLLPGQLSISTVSLAGHRYGKTLFLETIKSVSRLVRDPLLVDFFVDAGKDSEEVGASGVHVNVSTHCVHHIDGVVGLEFPRSGLERVGRVVEGTDGAKIDDVSGQLVGDDLLNVGADLVFLATKHLTEGVITSDNFCEADTSGAVNTPGHGGLDQGSDHLVLDGALVLHHSALIVSVNLRDVLEVTLASLIANGAVKGMVGQEEFHNSTIVLKDSKLENRRMWWILTRGQFLSSLTS
jgi:hypothetical protein